MNYKSRIAVGLMIVFGCVGLGAAILQPGLEPPLGPVSDTSPSLGDLEMDLDAIQVGVGNLEGGLSDVQQALAQLAGGDGGPWESAVFTPNGVAQYSSTQIATGQILIHKIIAKGVYVVLFNGAGSINSNGVVTSGAAVAAINFGDTGPATGHVLDVVVANGLGISWQDYQQYNTVTVLYKRL